MTLSILKSDEKYTYSCIHVGMNVGSLNLTQTDRNEWYRGLCTSLGYLRPGSGGYRFKTDFILPL